MNTIFTEKYRPKNLTDVKSQEHILSILNQIINTGEIENNFLFYGLAGTGKTSCALSFAKKYYGNNYKNMILELNASDERGINMVRNTISDFVDTKSFFSDKKKMIILDESDSMTIDAQNLLIKLMEDNKHNVIFFFICNYINKISLSITSRCLCFRFNKITFKDMSEIITEIAKNENIKLNNTHLLKDIYKFGNGDMRKCINIFQNLLEDNKIVYDNIYKVFDYPTNIQINLIIKSLLDENINVQECFKFINEIITTNKLSLINIVNEITYKLKDLISNTDKLLYIIDKLGDIEYNLTNDYNNTIQLYGFISIFKIKID